MALSYTFVAVLFALAGRNQIFSEATPVGEDDSEVCTTPACREAARVILSSMDTTVDPCDDFYQYACGGWIDKHPIPDDQSSYSTIHLLYQELGDKLIDILKTATESDNPRSVYNAGILFQGCIDEEARETQGLDPLKDVLDSFGGWPIIDADWSDVGFEWYEKAADSIRTFGSGIIISSSVGADAKDNSRHIIGIQQADFGLQREQLMNLTSSERNIQIVTAYRNYIISAAKLLKPNADETQLANDADEIIQFESALAQLSRPVEERKDPKYWYNKMTVSEVDRVTENKYFRWADYLNIVFEDFPQIADDTEVILADVDYTRNAIRLARNTDRRLLANYIGWNLVRALGSETTKSFRDIEFQFTQVLQGVEKPTKLETVCSQTAVQLLGFAVGRLYVDRYFTEEEKRDVDQIVEDLRSTYEDTLGHNTWMDPATKDKALEKLRAMVKMMGYPLWIKNDDELNNYYRSVPTLEKEKYFVSFANAVKALASMKFEKWDQPNHRTTEWITTPAVVNAFYNPSANTMTYPAAILGEPFYKYGRPLALNYGAIGSVVGHEITHGFDNQGSGFDKEGNLFNWWSKETKEVFEDKANCFRKQYSSYVERTTNMRLNGNNTIGDDIADNGGVRNAFIAYKMRALQLESDAFMANARLPGVPASPDQLFFLGYANAYCGHYRPMVLMLTIQYGDHTINEFRVTVPFSNSRAFSEAFSCPSGSRMNPESKCVLW